MKNNQDHFNILRKIDKKAYLNQRVLAKDLGLSLGKLNYCLNSLKKKGFVKLKNFKKILIDLIVPLKIIIYIFLHPRVLLIK